MLAGDFTAFASPACNSGRQIALRAPFVNNRIDPSQFSPAAMNLARRLPHDDRSVRRDAIQPAARSRRGTGDRPRRLPAHRQRHAVRPLHGHVRQAAAPLSKSDNVLTTATVGGRQRCPVADAGRHAGVRREHGELAALRLQPDGRRPLQRADFFEPSDLGVSVYNYSPTRKWSWS